MSTPRSQGRASLACLPCRRKKLRCNGQQPCERCTRSDPATCVFPSGLIVPQKRRADVLRTRAPTPALDQPSGAQHHGSPERIVPVHPPFSEFTYTGQSIPFTELPDPFIHPCAQPFPALLDPVDCGILTDEMARWLFDFFKTYCSDHIPLLHLSYEETKRQSSYLLSSITSVAYVNIPIDLTMLSVAPPSSVGQIRTSEMLSDLALNHLAYTIIHRQVSVEDVIATLNMALWNQKRAPGAGPSSWPLIGHAQRMMRRLELQDEEPLSSNGLVVMALDVYDHLYTLGYGRPLTDDRPPVLDDLDLLLQTDTPCNPIAKLVAASQLIPSIRRIIRWTHSHQTDTASLHTLLLLVNDDLDAWFFRWTSSASEHSAIFKRGRGSAYTVILAHHVRLCLNMLYVQRSEESIKSSSIHSEYQTHYAAKAYRLALIAAVEIIEMFSTEKQHTFPPSSLRCAPGIATSVLAHATLSLLPVPLNTKGSSQRVATLVSNRDNPIAKRHFETGLDLLRSDAFNQGHFTKSFADTISSQLYAEWNVSPLTIPDVPFESIDLMGWFGGEIGDIV